MALKRLKEIPQEKPLILIGSYYKIFEDMLRKIADEGFAEERIFSLYTIVETPEEALAILKEKI